MKYAYAYVLDSMADWELSYVIAELNSGQYFKNRESYIPVKFVGVSKCPVTTKGGMTIVPDMTIEDITRETSAILLLPGADNWKDPKHLDVFKNETLESWYNYFTTGDSKYFYTMMETLQ